MKEEIEIEKSNTLPMDTFEFAYWLKGFIDLNQEPPTSEQWDKIKQHIVGTFERGMPRGPRGSNF